MNRGPGRFCEVLQAAGRSGMVQQGGGYRGSSEAAVGQRPANKGTFAYFVESVKRWPSFVQLSASVVQRLDFGLLVFLRNAPS